MNGYELVRLQPNQLKKTGDTMTGDLKMSANIVPTTNNARDLGSSSLAFRKIYGSATSADKLTTARGFSINGIRKTFNGESDISWSLTEIGAAATNHNQASSTITAMTGYAKGSSSSAIATTDTLNQAIGKLENKVDSKANSTHTHNYAGSATAGGAATSAVKLQTPRAINGVNFDGTGAITTTMWGTARNIQIGNSTKAVNGSSNVNYTLSDMGAVAFDYNADSGDTDGKDYPRIHVTGKEWLRTPSGGIVPYANGKGYLGRPGRAFYDIHTQHFNGKPMRGYDGRWWNTNVDVGEDGVTELGKYIDFHESNEQTGDYTVRLTALNNILQCSHGFRMKGACYPTTNAQGGHDCGLITNRFYTVYCVNVNQSSDRNLKKDIHYLNDVHSLTKNVKSETPFKDFIKDELRIATYKYKRQQVVEDEEGNKTVEEMPNEEVDSQIGFIAQDIRNTDVGSLFVYGEDGNMSYSPAGFTSVVAKALQEEIKYRDKQIELLEAKIKLLEKKVDALV